VIVPVCETTEGGSLNITAIFGTRPEAIKLCPVIDELRKRDRVNVTVCVTGQHRQMLDQVLEVFGVTPDIDLNVMTSDQTLTSLSARLLDQLDANLGAANPDLVIVQGDTTTALMGALAAFYRRIPVAHVEAGLRTGNLFSPWPEEMNRRVVSQLATLHFAPTEGAQSTLLGEGVPPNSIWVTGNTVVDALQRAVEVVRQRPPDVPGISATLWDSHAKMVLITGHRRENFGSGLESICRALGVLASRFTDVNFVYPVHLNPNVREPVFRLLGDRPNVRLIEPVDYLSFVRLMDRAQLILTDSGGIQEEAPSMNKPVLVMRDTTERHEAIEAGFARLVGTDQVRIVEAVSAFLSDSEVSRDALFRQNPFGDGHASARIADACIEFLTSRPVSAAVPMS
jgi:UDP-N-acetylglucosamine 2-epimerase (non-hydrolysing)